MAIDLGAIYRASRLRVADLVDDSIADRPVPATPAWQMHDVIAHLAGVMHDVATGNVEGAATDPWTAAQVDRAREKSVAQLIDEWAGEAPGFEQFLSSPEGGQAGAAAIDVHAHETDLRSALGLSPDLSDEVVEWLGTSMRTGFYGQVTAAGLPPVTIDMSDFEMFRARLGRRTSDQVCAFGWSVDPAPYLDTFFLFGPTDHPVGT